MPKKTHDYDNVFKTMKSKHKRLFISVINDTFGKNYPMDVKVDILSSEGYFTENETKDGSRDIEEQISDFLLRIGSEIYLLECQSYDDDSMAIRIAEYAFLVARQYADWDIGHATIPMPRFAIIYVKRTSKTPKTTSITFTFPDGQTVCYESENVILEQFTYFRNEMLRLNQKQELSDAEMIDLCGFVNTIIKHITDGNKHEERLVKIMGGTIIETESEKWIRQGMNQGIQQGILLGQAKMIIELAQEDGLEEAAVLKKLQTKIGLSKEEAEDCMRKYGR